MSNGVFGTVRPANVSANDVEIWYAYHETRNYDAIASSKFQKLDSNILTPSVHVDTEGYNDSFLEGMYNLKLPLNNFGEVGFYTVYIKPKEHRVKIADIGVLSNFSDVRGIVLNTEDEDMNGYIKTLARQNNGLVGYRIQYTNTDSKTRDDIYRIITSNFACEPITRSDRTLSYSYNNAGTLSFLTVTPNTVPSYNANMNPFIGSVGQYIVLTNTKFNPVMLDLEITDHDAETISNMLEGSQIRNLDNGLITTFDKNGKIYHQSSLYSVKDEYTNKPMFEVKVNKGENIDFNEEQEFGEITSTN